MPKAPEPKIPRPVAQRVASLGSVVFLLAATPLAVLDQLPSKPLTAAAIADKLGLSKSSLRRKMAAQGVAFGDIVDRVRAGLAKRYLADGQKVKHVAYLCGYKSSSAFSAARRRWQSTKDRGDN